MWTFISSLHSAGSSTAFVIDTDRNCLFSLFGSYASRSRCSPPPKALCTYSISRAVCGHDLRERFDDIGRRPSHELCRALRGLFTTLGTPIKPDED